MGYHLDLRLIQVHECQDYNLIIITETTSNMNNENNGNDTDVIDTRTESFGLHFCTVTDVVI